MSTTARFQSPASRRDRSRSAPPRRSTSSAPSYFATIGVPLTRGRAVRRSRSRGVAGRRHHQRDDGAALLAESESDRPAADSRPLDRAGAEEHARDRRRRRRRQALRPRTGVRAADVRAARADAMAVDGDGDPHAARRRAGQRRGEAAVWAVDDTIPVPPVRSMEDAFAGAVGQPRFRAWLLGVFAAAAILLAMTGLYGTMAYAAHQRSREIGLRIALGATPRQATAPLVRQGLTLAAAGTLLGLAGSVGMARALAAMLFGVGVNDPRRSSACRCCSSPSRRSPATSRPGRPGASIRSRQSIRTSEQNNRWCRALPVPRWPIPWIGRGEAPRPPDRCRPHAAADRQARGLVTKDNDLPSIGNHSFPAGGWAGDIDGVRTGRCDAHA